MDERLILLVDDDSGIREVAQLALETTMGWQVISSATGDEAIQIAGSRNLSAIVLDVMMPEMDGAETFRRLQANPASRDVPVVLLTAKTQETDMENFRSLGVAGTVRKPFDPLDLGREIAAVLGWEAG